MTTNNVDGEKSIEESGKRMDCIHYTNTISPGVVEERVEPVMDSQTLLAI